MDAVGCFLFACGTGNNEGNEGNKRQRDRETERQRDRERGYEDIRILCMRIL